MSTVEATAVRRRYGAERGSWLRRLLLSEYLVLLLTALYVAAMVPLVPEIVAPDTWRDILGAMMPLLIVAVGQTFVLIVAGIDLSATSNLAIASVVGAAVMTARRRLLAWAAALARDRRGHRRLPRGRRGARARSTAPASRASACRPSS